MAPCPFPFTVVRYIDGYATSKSGAKVPVKVFAGRIAVPCGKCVACRRRKQNEWAFRCLSEDRYSVSSFFIGLSYDDDNLPISGLGEPTLVKQHLSKHIKYLRKDLGELKFFGCGEYGDTFGRPHYHYLLFLKSNIDHESVKKAVQKRWPYGFVDVNDGITPANAKYCAKYALKQVGFDYKDCVPPFALMSRRPGIGAQFRKDLPKDELRRRQQWHIHDQAGTPYVLPRYYRPYVYTDNEAYEHSLELMRVMRVKEDFEHGEFYQMTGLPDYASFAKHSQDLIFSREKEFIKQLKKEQYGFKFDPKSRWKTVVRQKRSSDDFKTDEFDL